MRYFLAAWPDEATRLALTALLDDVRQRVAHRRVTRVEDLHLTLTFIGEVPDNTATTVARAAEAARFEHFEWRLDRLGFFEPSGVVWAGADAASKMSRPLLEVATDLRRLLDGLGIRHDGRPLSPHVTLLHGVKRFTAEQIAPITWRIDSVFLYRSTANRSAARYERVPA